ncbi:hypothetical protein JHK82_047845 [Glycine max]|nr:hypothetical protein JHK82_047845 [Glycine max]
MKKGVLDESFGHRWLIFISILTQKFLQLVAKPLVGFGSFVENFLNLGALNGGVSGIVLNFFRVIDHKNMEAFLIISSKAPYNRSYMITKGFCISIDTLYPLWFMLLCCIPCFLLIILRFSGGLTRRISTNPVERKDIELVDEEEAQIGADRSSATSNKSEIYKEEARNAAQKHKPKRVESVNTDAEAFGDHWKIQIALCILKLKH